MMLLGSWPQILYFDTKCVKPQGLCSSGQLGTIPISVSYVSKNPGFLETCTFMQPQSQMGSKCQSSGMGPNEGDCIPGL